MLDKIAKFLTNIKNVVYVTWQGSILPTVAESTLSFFDLNHSEKFTLSFEDLPKAVNLLRVVANEKKLVAVFYDVKPMLSYAAWSLDKQKLSPNVLVLPDCNDLMVRERFLSIDKDQPKSCNEAIKRLSECKGGRDIHRAIHIPLFSVIPAIERSGLIKKSESGSRIVYPFYHIEGQANGRLNCTSPTEFNYNPHLIDEDLRKQIIPPGYDNIFIMADFISLEFVVLSHISGDQNMIEDANSEDPYMSALKRMFGKSEISPEYRSMAKDIFLPVFYGKTPPVLAKDLNCSLEMAQKIHEEIRKMYPKASWMIAEAERFANQNGFYEDMLKRKRYFKDNFWAARNMSVQSVSAIFCQERLISMHNAVKSISKIHASIHDGFLLSCNKIDFKETVKYVKISLELPSDIIPGLKARVKISSGIGLDNLSEVSENINY